PLSGQEQNPKDNHPNTDIPTKENVAEANRNQKNRDRRTMSIGQGSVELSAVQSIYVDPFGDSDSEQQLRSLLIKDLALENFNTPEKRSSADAVLQGTFKE